MGVSSGSCDLNGNDTGLNAGSGLEAIKVFQTSGISVIVSEIGMPDMDGYTFIQEIRMQDSMVPAIAVTAFSRGSDLVRAIDSGLKKHFQGLYRLSRRYIYLRHAHVVPGVS